MRAVSDDLGLAFTDQELQEMIDDARHPGPQLPNYWGFGGLCLKQSIDEADESGDGVLQEEEFLTVMRRAKLF